MMRQLHDFFETQPKFGPDQQNLVDMLRSPSDRGPPFARQPSLNLFATAGPICSGAISTAC